MSVVELDTIDKGIIVALQGDLGDSPEPYRRIAEKLGVHEDVILQRVQRMLDNGIIRRLGAMIRHIEAGIGFNGMVVWKVGPDRIEHVGKLMAGFREVTHCYERPPFGDKAGTLFTMVHASTEERCKEIIRDMARTAEIDDYEVLFSERELKKISPTYYDDDSDEEGLDS